MKSIAAILATAAVVLLVTGCGGPGPSSNGVATLPSPSAGSARAARTAPPLSAGGQTEQALAYAQCLRSRGVPDWPDPNGSGGFDKAQVFRAVGNLGSPLYQRYAAAATACQDLLPTSRELTAAQLQQDWTDDRNFAGCMRDAGVSNAPDPVSDGRGRPYFNLAGTGIDPMSPQILATARACQSQLHLSTFPPVSGGGGS